MIGDFLSRPPPRTAPNFAGQNLCTLTTHLLDHNLFCKLCKTNFRLGWGRAKQDLPMLLLGIDDAYIALSPLDSTLRGHEAFSEMGHYRRRYGSFRVSLLSQPLVARKLASLALAP